MLIRQHILLYDFPEKIRLYLDSLIRNIWQPEEPHNKINVNLR